MWWIKGEGEYKQFVANRVAKIQAVEGVTWHYVPTDTNPADIGSRGGQLTKLWLKGPPWLQDREEWPSNPVIHPTPETQAEAKAIREILAVAVEAREQDPYDELIQKFTLKKTLRVCAWI